MLHVYYCIIYIIFITISHMCNLRHRGSFVHLPSKPGFKHKQHEARPGPILLSPIAAYLINVCFINQSFGNFVMQIVGLFVQYPAGY